MNIAVLLLLGILFILGGCATSYEVKPIAQNGTEIQFQNGSECLISDKINIATIAPQDGIHYRSKRRAMFVVAVKNESSKKFNFFNQNIKVKYNDQDGSVFLLSVYSYEDLVAEERRRQAWAAIGAGLEAMGDSMSAANAGYSNTYGSYSGNSYSNYGSNYQHSGTFSAQTYDYGAAQAAQNAARAKSDANFRRIAEDARKNNAHLANSILRKHTVMPQQWHGGEIQFDLPKLTPNGNLIFTVDTNGEIHSFNFSIKREDNYYQREQSIDPQITQNIEETVNSVTPKSEDKESTKKTLLRQYINKEISREEYSAKMKTLN